jgi:hypothetical protein
MRIAVLSLLASLVFVNAASAWNDRGHKTVASIAFRRLTPSQQLKVVEVLKQHPRWTPDFRNRMPVEIQDADDVVQHEWAFQQAAIWPDITREFGGALRDEYHRSTWHYINLPIYLTADDKTALEGRLGVNLRLEPPAQESLAMNAVQTIRLARRVLADPNANAADKGRFAAWLFHVVGDLHQPMHSSALFAKDVFPGTNIHDQGGNLIPTEPQQKLHAFWDRLLGPQSDFAAAHDEAILFINDEALCPLGEQAAMQLNEETWLHESHALVASAVYSPGMLNQMRALDRPVTQLPTLSLDVSYSSQAVKVARQRIVEAGFRLGAVLAAIAE